MLEFIKKKAHFFNQGTLIKYAIEEFQKKHLNSANNNNNQIQNQKISTNDILYDKNLFPNIPEWLRLNLVASNQNFNDLNINQHLKQDQNSILNINNNYIELILFNQEEVKDLYFLDNSDYIDKDKTKHYHDGLKELNNTNTDLYINDIKTEFKKHCQFSFGNHKIKLIFKTKITDCKNMFYDCCNIKSIDLSNFDSSEVTDMSGMFKDCLNLKTINLSKLNTEKVNNMKEMFCNCKTLTSLDLSSFKTNNVKDMSSMFRGSFTFSFNLINLDLSSFDTHNVTDMRLMFLECENIKSIIIPPSFNTGKVINMDGMFEGCKNLISLDLSSFDTKNVYDMSDMFKNCLNLKDINLSSFDVKNVTFMDRMFYGCSKLTSLDLSKFKSEKPRKPDEFPNKVKEYLFN